MTTIVLVDIGGRAASVRSQLPVCARRRQNCSPQPWETGFWAMSPSPSVLGGAELPCSQRCDHCGGARASGGSPGPPQQEQEGMLFYLQCFALVAGGLPACRCSGARCSAALSTGVRDGVAGGTKCGPGSQRYATPRQLAPNMWRESEPVLGAHGMRAGWPDNADIAKVSSGAGFYQARGA